MRRREHNEEDLLITRRDSLIVTEVGIAVVLISLAARDQAIAVLAAFTTLTTVGIGVKSAINLKSLRRQNNTLQP